jgi:glyoxylase-like metal-dependent hydrolase (beta-lactamase superfamily II)
VDAGFFSPAERKELLDFLESMKLKPVGLVNTHCHFDHLMGVDFLRNEFSIPFGCHAEDAFWIPLASTQGRSFGIDLPEVQDADHFLTEDQLCHFGKSELRVIHVPGHSPGHVVFYSPEDHFLLAGDVLFYNSIGRFDLPGGNYTQLVENIRKKLLILPPETMVWSGHGAETSIGFEKMNNPYLV